MLPSPFSATLSASPTSARIARDTLRRMLQRVTDEEELQTVELLTTELVTNAVVHAATSCHLRVTAPRDRVLRVEVTDAADGTPAVSTADPTAPHGRGLVLVDALAAQWGVAPAAPTGKTVWFEVRC